MAAKRTKAQKQRDFLRAYMDHGTQSRALEVADVDANAVRKWIETDARFVDALRDAKDHVADMLEEVAMERARESSDTLMMFMLKGLRPSKYANQNRSENTLKVDEGFQSMLSGLPATMGPPAKREAT